MSSRPRGGRAALLTPRGNGQGDAMCPLPCKLGLGIYCKGGGWEELNSFRKKQWVQVQRQLSLALTCQLARALSATLSTANIFLEELLWVLIQALKCSWMFISIIIHWNPDTSFASCIICCKSKVTWSLFFVHTGVHTHAMGCTCTLHILVQEHTQRLSLRQIHSHSPGSELLLQIQKACLNHPNVILLKGQGALKVLTL